MLDADGHEIVYAGICRKGALGTRRLRGRLGARVDVVPNLADANVHEKIVASEPDLLVSWFWTKKIPKRVLAVAPIGAVGVHPSLLPRHRGPDPYFWAIDRGDAETGVTAHELDEEYDTGKIVAAARLAIDPSWNAWTLAKKLDRPSLALLRRTVKNVAATRRIESHAQDESLATEAPAPTDEELELSFDRTANEVVRRVRAASPWPGAWLAIGDRTIVVERASIADAAPRALAPGEAAIVDGRVLVRAKDGAVAIDRARDENDEILAQSELLVLFASTSEVEI